MRGSNIQMQFSILLFLLTITELVILGFALHDDLFIARKQITEPSHHFGNVLKSKAKETKEKNDEIERLNTRIIELEEKLKGKCSKANNKQWFDNDNQVEEDPKLAPCKKWGKLERFCRPVMSYEAHQKYSFTCETDTGATATCDLFILFVKNLDGRHDQYTFKFKGEGCGNDGDREKVLERCTIYKNSLISAAEACRQFPGANACTKPDNIKRMSVFVEHSNENPNYGLMKKVIYEDKGETTGADTMSVRDRMVSKRRKLLQGGGAPKAS